MKGAAPGQRVYLDACIAIYYVERNPALFPAIEASLLPADGPGPRIAYSDLVRLECRVSPLRRGDQALLARFDAFFNVPGRLAIALDAPVFDSATQLRATHRLKTPDALHLAAAIRGGCDAFWTNDDRLRRAAENHVAIVVF
jgi:predicted nucleic acid-binding protein